MFSSDYPGKQTVSFPPPKDHSPLAEAPKQGLPLVLIGTVEEAAWLYLVKHGCAMASPDNVELAEFCIKLLDDAALRTKISGAYLR